MKKISILLVCLFTVALAGCETMKGLGQDIQSAGQALEKKAAE
ncbi:MAG: entericidin A/B family lipoprotein [Gammaproteobacteria bacterium]|nr:entericidin A/B family lipoprotein [Gammaproteobacteria bacterium]